MVVGKPWKDTGWYIHPKGAAGVMTAVARVGTHGTNHRFAWRGLASCDHELTSSLHRQLVSEGVRVTEEAFGRT